MLQRLRPLVLLIPALAVCALTGCGRSRDVVYRTRYVPTVDEMTWEGDLKQLPWRPPALGEVHYPRAGHRLYMPGPGATVDHDVERGAEGRFPGDKRPSNHRPDRQH